MKDFKLLIGFLALAITVFLFYFDKKGEVSIFLQGMFFGVGIIFLVRYFNEKYKK